MPMTLFEPGGYCIDAPGIELQPVEQRWRDLARFRGGDVERIGRQQVRRPGTQRVGGRLKGCIFLRGGGLGKLVYRRPGGPAKLFHISGDIAGIDRGRDAHSSGASDALNSETRSSR